MSEGQAGKPSVFGAVNQDEIIAKIDAVGDDDLSSCFFGDSLADVENAATRVFDIGVRDGEDAPEETGPGPFGPTAVRAGDSTAAATPPSRHAAAQGKALAEDAAARQAFILGGPGAIRGD